MKKALFWIVIIVIASYLGAPLLDQTETAESEKAPQKIQEQNNVTYANNDDDSGDGDAITNPLSSNNEASSAIQNDGSLNELDQEKQETDLIPIAEFGYTAAVPHFGPLIRTVDFTATYQENKALVSLPEGSDLPLKQNQNVILYDKNGKTLPLGGKIENIDNTTITISLPEATDTSRLNNKVSVITLETIGSKRLPLSALQKDNNDQSFVWVATPAPNGNGHIVEKRAITVDIKGQTYFEAGLKVRATDLVILDPDFSLTADKKYRITISEITDAPLHNPIKQAWIDFEMNRLEEAKAEMAAALEDCLNGAHKSASDAPALGATTNPDGTTNSGSCGGNGGLFNGETDPIAIFNSILNTGANGCSASCGQ